MGQRGYETAHRGKLIGVPSPPSIGLTPSMIDREKHTLNPPKQCLNPSVPPPPRPEWPQKSLAHLPSRGYGIRHPPAQWRLALAVIPTLAPAHARPPPVPRLFVHSSDVTSTSTQVEYAVQAFHRCAFEAAEPTFREMPGATTNTTPCQLLLHVRAYSLSPHALTDSSVMDSTYMALTPALPRLGPVCIIIPACPVSLWSVRGPERQCRETSTFGSWDSEHHFQ